MADGAIGSNVDLMKKVYGDNFEKLPWEEDELQKLFPFKKDSKLGSDFNFAVALSMSHGRTFNGTAGSIATLATSISPTVGKAVVTAYEYIHRDRIAYRLMNEATAQGPAAFEDATRVVLEAIQEGTEKSLAMTILYGQEGLGIVESNTSGALVITAASWSAATWQDMEGAILEAWTGVTASETQHNGDLTISAVDLDARTVTVTGTSAAVVANDVLYLKGARTTTTFNEMAGISKIIGNSGTIFGLSAANYSRWRGNSDTTGGTPTLLTYQRGVSKMANRGFRKKVVNVLMPVAAYDRLNDSLSGNIRKDVSYSKSKGTSGFENIEVYGSVGTTRFIPHPLVRDGHSFACTEKNGFRVGACDTKFQSGDGGQHDVWFDVADKSAKEARATYIQAVAFRQPSATVKFSGFTYS